MVLVCCSIDDRMTAMDEKWDRALDELRAVRAEMHAGFSELRADLCSFRKQVLTIVAAFAVGLIGLLDAFVAAQC
jgi:hypothetical protein